MSSRFSLSRVSGVLAALGLSCTLLVLAAQAVPTQNAQAAPVGRVILYPATPDKKGELPPVPFNHDAHAKAMQDRGKDCASCHQAPAAQGAEAGAAGKQPLSYAFKDTAGKKAGALKDGFHDGCISCHATEAKTGKSSGPQEAECRTCHNGPAPSAQAGKPFDPTLDKGLHARHVTSREITAPGKRPGSISPVNCAACHHALPGAASGIGTRQSCSACHEPFRETAHNSCITCHLSVAKAKKPSGPVNCSGCHDAATWNKYARPAKAQPIFAGQPSSRLMAPKSAKDGNGTQASLPPVPFNHKLHEQALPTCRSCHHKDLSNCSSCHTTTGAAKGGNVTMSQAMHKADSTYSCVGCHEKRKTTTPQCAGCHTPKPAAMTKQNCAFCHKGAASAPAAASRTGTAAPGSEGAAPGAEGTVPAAPPEKVTIGILSNEFEPCVLNHGDIIRAMNKSIEKTAPSLAAMHAENYTACVACHHNSPPSATPPKCASCHDKSAPAGATAAQSGNRPLLKAAYHQQCMGCHDRMQVKKPANTDCAGCHAKRVMAK